MDIAALILSVIALSFSVFIYFRHDKKLKKQEASLNQWQLDRQEAEKVASISAKIKVERLIRQDSSGRNGVFLLISNVGQAKAQEVVVVSRPNMLVGNGFRAKFINPGQVIERVVVLGLSDSDEFEVSYDWEDGIGHHSDSTMIYFG